MIRFNANLFRIAFMCASNEETRYYLNGVFVEPHAQGGVTLTATDGHRLICIRDASGSADEAAIINMRDALKQCKPKRDERRDVVIQTGSNDAGIVSTIVDPEGLLIDTPISMAYGTRVDGSFPDYRRVVPQTFFDKAAPTFCGKHLASLGEIGFELAVHFHAWVPGKSGSWLDRKDVMRVLPEDCERPEDSPALVLWQTVDAAFAVIMPAKTREGAELRAPSWFRYPTAPIAQAAE